MTRIGRAGSTGPCSAGPLRSGVRVDYWTMTTGPAPGPGAQGVLVYIEVEDIDRALSDGREAGGTVVTGKMPIPTVGWSARFRDTEGNLVGLFQTDPTVPRPGAGVPG